MVPSTATVHTRIATAETYMITKGTPSNRGSCPPDRWDATPAESIPPSRLLAVGDTFGIRDRGSGALMLELVFS